MELNIGDPSEKIKALQSLVGFAHLARDKALDTAKQFTEELKLEAMQWSFEKWENWSREFYSNSAPKERGIDFILSLSALTKGD